LREKGQRSSKTSTNGSKQNTDYMIMKTITSWQQVPSFSNEKTEAEFWSTHQLDPNLIKGSLHGFDSRESTTITMRFDPRMLSKVKRVARSRYLNYQSMIKQWLAERLEEEVK
jgi:predicted DNA binding CopG/RHH family protein